MPKKKKKSKIKKKSSKKRRVKIKKKLSNKRKVIKKIKKKSSRKIKNVFKNKKDMLAKLQSNPDLTVDERDLLLFEVPKSSFKILTMKPLAICEIDNCNTIAYACCDVNADNYDFSRKCYKKICYKHCI